MQLSPLQSRLAASAVATVLLIILYFSLFNPQFAFAQELGHDRRIILDDDTIVDGIWEGGISARDELLYEPEFDAFDRNIIGRAADVQSLVNNVPIPMNLNAGQTMPFKFESSQILSRQEESRPLELRAEQSGSQETAEELVDRAVLSSAKTVYISANTCLQPLANSTTDAEAPQLTLYVSTSSENTSPGPSADADQQEVVPFTEGAVMLNMSTSDDIYLTIAASNISSSVFSGIYNFQVAASVDGWYHSYDDSVDADLIWVDSDIHSVLLMTNNLTQSTDEAVDQKIMGTTPYVMFAQSDEDRSINGMKYSYCGLNNYAQIAAVRNGQATSQVTTGITRRGAGNLPKQQFYFSGLNASTTYKGILASNANATTNVNVVGGGGHVYRATSFETKSNGGNCAVVFNLTFCDEVAYAVPSNNITFPNVTLLGDFYDKYAESLYDGFNKSLQQIACEAPNSQQFSLVRNCSTCAAAYKTWLCSVTIPRCEDFSSNDSWLQPRAMLDPFPDGSNLSDALLAQYSLDRENSAFLSSRNPLIDSEIKPGPYKEVLPCQELCYDLVQSCPAALGFACPRPWLTGFNTSYGVKPPVENGSVMCNYPGAAHTYSASSTTTVPWIMMSALMAFALL